MSPETPAGKRKSGNPATQAEINLSQKQQREQRKKEKLAEYQRQMAKRRRSKLVWWVLGSTAAVAVVAVVAGSYILTPRPVSYQAFNSTGTVIEGVETFNHSNLHVEGTVDYGQTPPAGGEHNSVWLNCGEYTQPIPNENAVHSLEHGAVWVTYDPARVSDADVDVLRGYLPSSYYLLSPYEGMDTPIAVSAWNAQLKVADASDPRITEFFQEYWRSQNTPEPNATCAGGITADGRA